MSPIGIAEEFANTSIAQLIELLQRIINREAPIHILDISKRIVSFWGITRLNKSIKDKLDQAMAELLKTNQIKIKDDFIWSEPKPSNIVRNRQGTRLCL